MGLWRGVKTWVGMKELGVQGTGESSEKGNMSLKLRIARWEPDEAVSVEGETPFLPGAQGILEFPLKVTWRPEKDPKPKHLWATGSIAGRPGRGGFPQRTWSSLSTPETYS